jgi:hypothetical protein
MDLSLEIDREKKTAPVGAHCRFHPALPKTTLSLSDRRGTLLCLLKPFTYLFALRVSFHPRLDDMGSLFSAVSDGKIHRFDMLSSSGSGMTKVMRILETILLNS